MDLDWIASVCDAKRARRVERVQSLWGGYGEIVRVALDDERTVIVKSVSAPERPASDVSHARKQRSYDVEQAFYARYANECGPHCRVATRIATRPGLLVLEDLGTRRLGDEGRALRWLAAFHATFLDRAPEGLWPIGTYWHLATRREELAAVKDAELAENAAVFDQKLASCTHQTFVHGDAKRPNFCVTPSGDVAAVDFQYVGGGPGVKDVAYLIGGEHDERARLGDYFTALASELDARGHDPEPILTEWRALYPVACADFQRFLAGWRLTARG